MGHQIYIALDAKTKKMHQGHRGSNHPVKNLNNNIVEITSQIMDLKLTEILSQKI